MNLTLSSYLRSERDHGRISPHTDPEATAEMLMGACFQRAFYRHFYGEAKSESLDTVAATLVDTVLGGIEAQRGQRGASSQSPGGQEPGGQSPG